jgi:tetratricopeptide (TPR) repeat protein
MSQIDQLLEQGMALHQRQQYEAAGRLYQQVLQLDSKHPDAHNLLGAVHVMYKNYKLAEKHLLKSIKLSGSYAPAHYNLGKTYLDQGKLQLAFGALSKAVKLKPDYVEAIFLLANTQVRQGDLPPAQVAYEKVIAWHPRNYEAHNNLGSVLQDQSDYHSSLEHHQAAINLKPDFELAYLNLSNALVELERHNDALELLSTCLGHCNNAKVHHEIGRVYQQLGQMKEARSAYLSAISIDPSEGKSYRYLVDITKNDSNENIDLMALVSNACQLDNITTEAREHLNFALAKLLDGLKDYSGAFSAYKAGNDLHRALESYKNSDSVILFNSIKSAYNKNTPTEVDDPVSNDNRPIFILGMPRSGTTLVEQIIASHSSVTGAGELPYLADQVKQAKGGVMGFHKRFAKMNHDQLSDVAKGYLAGLNKYDQGLAKITDKMPHNFLYIGLIAKLLPNAKIIHCKRHPMANCLSIYKAYFASKNAHPYAWDLKELAHYHNLYEDLMAHWRDVLPGRFYEVSYEQLTSNQEEESRKLIEYCGLDWQEACLDFHNTQRKVKTASVFQVRQPMHNQSVDLWKRYGDALQPLLDNLYIPPEYVDE